jgi:hypothetical protein
MQPDRPPLGAVSRHIYEAPPADGGSSAGDGERRIRLPASLAAIMGLGDTMQHTSDPQAEATMPDTYKVGNTIDGFMENLYDDSGHPNHRRHREHTDRMADYHRQNTPAEGMSEEDYAEFEAEIMALKLHDFVDQAILNPEDTAQKLGLTTNEAQAVKDWGVDTYNELLESVENKVGLTMAFSFAVDASHWEATAESWRERQAKRIDELAEKEVMDKRTALILKAAILKMDIPEGVSDEEFLATLKSKQSLLRELELEEMSDATLDHNIQGLFVKAVELIDNIKNPPKDNPASTYRDCIEAINFFAPALRHYKKYKQLANDLEGAALEWWYDDPDGHAKRQHEASNRRYENVKDAVLDAQQKVFGRIETETESRVKSEGSIRAKLAKGKYKGIHLVPDGIGFAFIVPNDMSIEDIEDIADTYGEQLTGSYSNIIAKHPHPGEDAVEITKGEDSNYEAVHLTFYYYPTDGSGDIVPFEIQILTKDQYKAKLDGENSDMHYKAGVHYDPSDQPYLDHFSKRAESAHELGPVMTVMSTGEMIALSERLTFVFNELYRAVDTEKGQRIILPTELQKTARDHPEMFADLVGDTGELTVLPATHVSEEQFGEALRMYGLNLHKNEMIANALDMVRRATEGKVRKNGVTPVLEGHILPTALSALMLAVQSGKILDSKEFGPMDYMSNIVTVALLHDYVEDAPKESEDEDISVTLERRRRMLLDIRAQFGETISQAVAAITSPTEIEDDDQRRQQYAENIQTNDIAQLVKPADRMQNHICDLVELASYDDPTESPIFIRTMQYFGKSEKYQLPGFTAEGVPTAYSRMLDIVWRLAKHFGYSYDQYKPKDTSEKDEQTS